MTAEKLADVLGILDRGAGFELLGVVPQIALAKRSGRALGFGSEQRPGGFFLPDPRT